METFRRCFTICVESQRSLFLFWFLFRKGCDVEFTACCRCRFMLCCIVALASTSHSFDLILVLPVMQGSKASGASGIFPANYVDIDIDAFEDESGVLHSSTRQRTFRVRATRGCICVL